MISAILFISFFIFLILGVPIGICLGLSSVCAILYSGTSLTIVATNMYSGISKFLLLAIPFFVLSGNIMAKAGISKRLIKFVDTCVGHKKGGIAIVCVIVACFFGAISGSGPATVAALGAVLIPAMVEQGGFSAPFSTALMATSSSIAIVIPPSIAFVVYASITGVSIADMFMAGIVPGLLLALQETYDLSDEQIKQGLYNASAIGYLAMRNATVAGAVGGCQAEVGIASAMAASATVELMGGSPEQSLAAASTVLMNMLGLVCDPVGGLVEYPCQNRNAAGVANATIAAEIALSGVRQLIPFDEMLEAVYTVGKRLPAELRETALGGCATTPSACAACHMCN
mgnify:FL=1